jgi:cell shape-determining protein MreC
MRNLVPIEDEPSYQKDAFSQALINTDTNMLAEYKARRKTSKEMRQLKEEINTLKKELNTIKSFLKLS